MSFFTMQTLSGSSLFATVSVYEFLVYKGLMQTSVMAMCLIDSPVLENDCLWWERSSVYDFRMA